MLAWVSGSGYGLVSCFHTRDISASLKALHRLSATPVNSSWNLGFWPLEPPGQFWPSKWFPSLNPNSLVSSFEVSIQNTPKLYVFINGFYDAYDCHGIVRQVSGSSVSVRRVHVISLLAGSKGGGTPCLKTRETVELGRGIQKKPGTLSWDWTQDTGTLAHGFTHWATREPRHQGSV